MIWDWLAREGWIVFNWWLLVTLAGIAAWPLCIRLLNGLPDKGYIFARAIGLLLVGFVFWFAASIGLLNNSSGSIIVAWATVLIISLLAYLRLGEPLNWRVWWRENRTAIIVAELLFAILLFSWALYRAAQPALTGTEKPMELAFMSAVQRSGSFPPNDPWLSGYAISYYYFGYVMSAMLSMLSGIRSTIGFNMTIALLFALTGLNAFGLVYNLVRSRAFKFGGIPIPPLQRYTVAPVLTGIAAVVFLVFFGNFQMALIEIPYRSAAVPQEYLEFWGTQARANFAEGEYTPRYEGFIIDSQIDWFRASRVLTDYNLDGTLSQGAQPIDEFPMFSFVLADVHPHVLALPFAVLALGLALNLLLSYHPPTLYEQAFYGVALGGLVFLNTWDGPIYIAVLLGTDALRRILRNPDRWLHWADLVGLFKLAVVVGGVALIAYSPFIIGFRSQAGGLLPNIATPTLFRQYFIMFGPFLLILAPYLLLEMWRGRLSGNFNLRQAFALTGLLLALLISAWAIFILIGAVSSDVRSYVSYFLESNGGWERVLPALIQRRVSYSLTTFVLLGGVVLILARILPLPDRWLRRTLTDYIPYPPATGFALLLVGVGLMLSLVPEFIYLRDNFGTRINTIFKFYYQVWVVFAVASAYAVYSFLADKTLPRPSVVLQGAFGGVVAVVSVLALLYPLLSIHNRVFIDYQSVFRRSAEQPVLSLDGTTTIASGDELIAIQCLDALVKDDDAVVLEAQDYGSAYKWWYGRVGTLTGIPIVIGWTNHESQWRGPTYGETVGSRPEDVDRIYSSTDWLLISELLRKYDVDYIFFGATERSKYGPLAEDKFIENFPVVCDAGSSRVYQVVEDALWQIEP
ncbi:MAG: hypothetical protein D6712_08490 [Chloroflexi bacterium]|nr:MAG: hypothetical protein D6712_08490 [Chloroflexota bacterium]